MSKEQFEKLKSAIRTEQKNTEKNRYRENMDEWPVYDSKLVGRKPRWQISYDQFFRNTYPAEFPTIREYIESYLDAKQGNAIGIDIGGSGSTLFQGFKEKFFAATFGMGIVDRRTKIEKETDDKNNHHMIVGDAFTSADWKKLYAALTEQGAQGVDLIFEKMHGALHEFPENLDFLYGILNRWYKLLNTPGVMFVEFPTIKGSLERFQIKTYIERLEERTPGIVVNYDARIDEHRGGEYLAIRIEKNKGAPENLPK